MAYRPSPLETEAFIWDLLPQVVPWSQRGFEYVKWLQGALNQVLKLKLTIDGDPGPHTMNAIQMLQGKSSNKLVRIGLVGPWTDRALTNAGAHPPPIFAPPAAVGIDCDFDTRKYVSCIPKATF